MMTALRAFYLLLMALLFLNVWCEEAQANPSNSSSTDDLVEQARKAAKDIFDPVKGPELVRNLTTQLIDLSAHFRNLSQRQAETPDRAARVLQESMATN